MKNSPGYAYRIRIKLWQRLGTGKHHISAEGDSNRKMIADFASECWLASVLSGEVSSMFPLSVHHD